MRRKAQVSSNVKIMPVLTHEHFKRHAYKILYGRNKHE